MRMDLRVVTKPFPKIREGLVRETKVDSENEVRRDLLLFMVGSVKGVNDLIHDDDIRIVQVMVHSNVVMLCIDLTKNTIKHHSVKDVSSKGIVDQIVRIDFLY